MEPQDGGVDETIQWEEGMGEGREQALQAGDSVLVAVNEGSLQQIQGPPVDEEPAIEKLQAAGDGDVSDSGGGNKVEDVGGSKDVWRVARDGDDGEHKDVWRVARDGDDGEHNAGDVSGSKDVWRVARDGDDAENKDVWRVARYGDAGEQTSEHDEVELSQPSRLLELIEVGGGASTVAGLVQPGVGGETALVMSPHIHAVPRDTSGFLQPGESSDGGEAEGSLRYVEYARDAGEGQDRDTGQTVAGFTTGSVDQTVAGFPTGSVDQTVAGFTTGSVDQTVAGINTGSVYQMVEAQITQRPGDDGRSQSPSQFPALDNVDLESDDDGDSGSRLAENIAQDGEDPLSSVSGHRDLHQEFPLNYQNYKVCRELSPGVKQCLILETGEQYIYVSEHKPTPDGSLDPFPEDVELDRPGLQPGSDYYHPISAPVADWDGSPVTARVPNDADTFASLQDRGRGVDSDRGRDNSQQSQTGNSRDNSQQSQTGNSRDNSQQSQTGNSRDNSQQSQTGNSRDNSQQSQTGNSRDNSQQSQTGNSRDNSPQSQTGNSRDNSQQSQTGNSRDNSQQSQTGNSRDNSQQSQTGNSRDNSQQSQTSNSRDNSQQSQTSNSRDNSQQSQTGKSRDNSQQSQTGNSRDNSQQSQTGNSRDNSQQSQTGNSRDNSQQSQTGNSRDNSQQSQTGNSRDNSQQSQTGNSRDNSQQSQTGNSRDNSQHSQTGNSRDNSQQSQTGNSRDNSQQSQTGNSRDNSQHSQTGNSRDNSQQSQTGNSRVITFLENATGNDDLVLHAEEGMSEPRVFHEEDGMSESRVVHAESGSAPSGEENVRSDEQEEGLPGMDLVEDVLGSEAETSQQSSSESAPSLKKSRRAKPERFVELQPEIVTVFANDRAGMSESDANNNSNGRGRDVAANTNDNAISRSKVDRLQQRGDVSIRSSHYPSDRSYQADRGDQAQPYDHYKTDSRGVSTPGSRSYSQPASRESSYFDSRGQRSGEGSPFYRSRDPSSADTSQLSTRYTRVERGDPRSWQTKPESVTIPKFKTLHDQQVNWLEMFKMIEQQHRSELQSQYQEHQKILQEMQRNMEKELIKQQDTLKQRLLTHREMLEELSPGLPAGQNVNQSWMKNDRDSLNSRESSEHAVTNNTSRITLQGVPVSLRNPPPVTRYHHDTRHHKTADDLPVKRSLEKELSSPVRPADTSLNLSSQAVSIDRDKQLRGGVYSSPFPLAKVKHKRSPRGSKSYENIGQESSRDEVSHNTNSVHWEDDRRVRKEPRAVSADVSLTESEEAVSLRTRVGLEEKHAKQLVELQAYYEKELQTLREARAPGGLGVTAADKILANENQELQEKCRQLQEAYHDAKIEIRELQQKIQGLEIRSADYAERYSATQSQVMTLKSRLEELADYAREKEAAVADLSNKDRKSAESVQVAYKKEKELTESLHNAKSTIQKLVDKYEMLEKDHDVLKETSAEMQGKLYNSRAELVETNNKLSRLEVENKHLKRDVESLRQHLSMAQGPTTMTTSYEDSYHKATRSPDRAQSAYSSIHVARNRSPERSYNGHSVERHRVRSDMSSESDSDNDLMQSPIMKAERELKKLQESPEFAPKLQRKFYGTERPSSYIGTPITVDRSHSLSSPHSAKVQSPKDKDSLATSHNRDSNARPNTSISAYFSRSQLEGSRQSKDNEKTSSYQVYKDGNSNRNPNISHNRSGTATNGLTTDQAIERVKSGEIVSRPAWEDIYTSLTPARRGVHESKGSPLNHARDQLFRERLQNIENLEKKYDDLTNEKRKHEAALSKLPGHGQGRERDRLETELDRVDRELGSVRMSLKRYHVLKSTI